MSKVLIYQGGGFLPGVPARDITDADVARFNLDIKALAASPLYKKVTPAKKSKDKEVKDG